MTADDDDPHLAAETLDARGLRCPMPVIRMEAALRRMAPGARLKVIADDPVAAVDIPHFCREGGHDCRALRRPPGAGEAAQKSGKFKSFPEEDPAAGGAGEGGARRTCVFLVTRGEKR